MKRRTSLGDHSVARQCSPVGNSKNEEEWSNDLLIVIRKQCSKIAADQKDVETSQTCAPVRGVKKRFATELAAAHGPIYSRKEMA